MQSTGGAVYMSIYFFLFWLYFLCFVLIFAQSKYIASNTLERGGWEGNEEKEIGRENCTTTLGEKLHTHTQILFFFQLAMLGILLFGSYAHWLHLFSF